MKCTIPEIFWHNREPVLSVDIQPKPLENDPNKNIRLASAGSDQHVLVCIFVFFLCRSFGLNHIRIGYESVVNFVHYIRFGT